MNNSVQKFQKSKLNREYKYGWKNSIPLGFCTQKSLMKIDFYIELLFCSVQQWALMIKVVIKNLHILFKEDLLNMADAKKKGRLFDLPETRGAFQLKGVVSGVKKDTAYKDLKTKSGKDMRIVNFGVG